MGRSDQLWENPHWGEPPVVRQGSPGEHMYHRSSPVNSESIRGAGLEARRCAGALPGDPDRGVYMTSDDHVFHAGPDEGAPRDPGWRARTAGSMWKVNVSGLPLVEDRTYTKNGVTRAWISPHDIPPERIAAHEPGSEHGVTYDLPGGERKEWLPSRTAAIDGEDTERYVTCEKGCTHWGAHGASFLLMRHTDPDDGKIRYLFQHRADNGMVDHPDTWGLPGGALHEGESSYAGARREAREEMGDLPRMRRHHTVADDHGGWKADTHVADVADRFEPQASEEADDHRWVTKAEADQLDMHPGVARTWDTVRRSQVNKEAGAVRQVPSRRGPDAVSKSMMVAIVPPAAALDMLEGAMAPLTRHDAEPRSKMHITVLYLGEEDDHPEAHLSKLPDLVRQWATTVEPFHVKLQGAGTFVADGKHVLHALADIPGDAKIRTSLEEFLHGHGIHFPRDHGFVPHITLAYSPDHVRFLPKITPTGFPVSEIWHCRGGRWESMPLGRRNRKEGKSGVGA